jgi:lysophospholipase L1-like esterase
MVKQILAVKKIPVIGTVIWAKDGGFRQRNLELYNAALKRLKENYLQILDGPDLYGRFKDHPEWFQDDLHLSAAGRDILRKAWVQWAVDTVYAGRRKSASGSVASGALGQALSGVEISAR